MGKNDFELGYIQYTSEQKTGDEISAMNLFDVAWNDGYLAFSGCEKRLKDFDGQKLADLIKNLNERVNEETGYLMEIGLWREDNNVAEEVCLEREDQGFYIQRWTLHMNEKPMDNCDLCYYRRVKVYPRANTKIFRESPLSAAHEVVVSLKRLHFFITCGQEN